MYQAILRACACAIENRFREREGEKGREREKERTSKSVLGVATSWESIILKIEFSGAIEFALFSPRIIEMDREMY